MFERINATWQDSLEYESSYQVRYMREFLEKTEWYNLVPRFDNISYFVPANTALGTYYIGARPKATDMALLVQAV